MTTQASPIILGQRFGPEADESGTSDLQRTLSKVVAILSRRRWLFVMPMLAALLVSLAIGLTKARRYWITARFERRNDDVITKLVNKNTPYSFASLRDSLTVDLKGYNTVNAVVEQLDLTRDYPRGADGNLTPEGIARKRALVGRLTREITIGLDERSPFLDIIDLRYMGEEPEIATQVMNQLTRNYMETSRAKATEILTSSHEFFSREAEKEHRRVLELEADLLRMGMEQSQVGPIEPGLLDHQLMKEREVLEELERRRRELQSKITAREEYLKELEGRLDRSGLPEEDPGTHQMTMMPNPRRAQLAAEMEKIRAEIADAKAIRQVTDRHPDIAALRRKLENVRREHDAQPEQVASASVVTPRPGNRSGLDRWLAEGRRTEMELKSLRETLAEEDRQIEKHKAEQSRLEKAGESLFERREAYLLQQKKLTQAKADHDAWKSPADQINRILTAEAEKRGIQFATLQEAHGPGSLIAPTLPGIYLISIGVALGLGVALVFLREVFDRSFRNPARVRQALGIPVLETIGEIQIGRPPGWFVRHRLLPAVACLQVLAVVGLGALVYLRVKEPTLYDGLLERAGAFWTG